MSQQEAETPDLNAIALQEITARSQGPGCYRCRFYYPALGLSEDEPSHGDCRRHAPIRIQRFTPTTVWPDVNARSWCGDWEPRLR